MNPIRILVTAAILVAGGPALAQVGVTSSTAGDPLGKPPAQNERVLRVGVDVVANERVTTKADDRAHLVFLDGTALTVGPNSSLTIDKFVYDPNGKIGEIVLGTTKGVFRLVGGNISKTGEIKVTTPSASIGIRGGIATIVVAENGTTKATFLYGKSMTVSGQGQTQVATRAGSQIQIDSGRAPTAPAIVPRGGDVEGAIIERPRVAEVVPVTPPTPPAVPTAPVISPLAAPVAPVITVAAIDQALQTSQITTINSARQVAELTGSDSPGRGQQQRQGRGPSPQVDAVLRLEKIASRGVTQQNATKAQDVSAGGGGGVGNGNGNGGNSRNANNGNNGNNGRGKGPKK